MENYSLGEVLGQGSFGKVYKATDVRNGGVVAVKTVECYDPTTVVEKIRALKLINHDRVIRYTDSLYSNHGWFGIVMEFADMGTLEDLRPPLATQSIWKYVTNWFWNKEEVGKEYNVWRLLAHIAEPLHCLHTSDPVPIVHRDLKPANILFKTMIDPRRGQYPGLKLADYAIASLLNKKAEKSYYDTTCTVGPVYTAPEVP